MKTCCGGIGSVSNGYELDPQHPRNGRASADRHLAARLLRSHGGPARGVGAEPVGDQRRLLHADQRSRRRHGGARQGGLRTRLDLGRARGGRSAARGPVADAGPARRAGRRSRLGHRAARQRARRHAHDPRRALRAPDRRRTNLSRRARRGDHRDRRSRFPRSPCVRCVASSGCSCSSSPWPRCISAPGCRRICWAVCCSA